METSVISALIGASATILAVFIAWWLQHQKTANNVVRKTKYTPDRYDVHFMTYLLHDAYETGIPMSTSELTECHDKFAPLELEVKLIKLEKYGYIKRVSKNEPGLGHWLLTPQGVEFMFENEHQLQDLVDEQRPNA